MNIALAIAAYLLVSFLLAGCSSPAPGSPESFMQKQQAKHNAQQAMIQDTIDDLPKWYKDVPKSDYAILSAGVATSPHLQLAVDKAILNAKRMLADRVEGLLSSQVKQYVSETGREIAPMALMDSEHVTKNVLRDVNVSGYRVEDMDIKSHGTYFRVYVLLMYPLGEMNDILTLRQRQREAKERVSRTEKAYDELEKERRVPGSY